MQRKWDYIDPYGLYTASDLESMIGSSGLVRLRQHGLRAIGDRYLGSIVIEVFHRAWQAASQENGADPEPQPISVSAETRNILRAPKPKPKPETSDDSLASQLEQVQRKIQSENISGKLKPRRKTSM